MKTFRKCSFKLFNLRKIKRKRRNGQPSTQHLTEKMSSAICQHFVQNAWKKDLCSNCFKSKDEHNQECPPKLKATPIKLKKPIESIIKTSSNKSLKPKRSVEFTKELVEIIGFGGEDCFSDEEIDEDGEETSDDDDDFLNDDKELEKLTKNNTEFNANLPPITIENGNETKKSYTHLLLGRPQLDSEGKKQTLLVSVTPFGQGENSSITGNNRKYNINNNKNGISHIPVAKNVVKDKEIKEKEPTNVILTSYTTKSSEKEKSLLDEISETLEKSKNPIQIVNNRKKIETEILLKPDSITNKDNVNKKQDDEGISLNEESDNVKGKSTISERKNGLSRTAIIKKDQEKPIIYQTSTAKIELMNTKNLNSNNKDKINKLDVNGKEKILLHKDNEKNDLEKRVSLNDNKIDVKMSKENVKEKVEVKEDEVSDTSLTSTGSSSSEENSLIIEENKQIPELKIPSQNREQPDGRADPEESEPPALPLTPPPTFDSSHNSSFLHGQVKTSTIQDKPKIPCKPSTILIRKPINNVPSIENHPQPVVLTTFIPNTENKSETNLNQNLVSTNNLINGKPKVVKLEKQDSGSKRKAPKPPLPDDEKIDDKKDRFSMLINNQRIKSPKLEDIYANSYQGLPPEPLPRRSLSLSSDNLLAQSEEKKKRARFSLKKFLRMGSNKDLNKTPTQNDLQQQKINLTIPEDFGPAPQIKPRLVIVHPSELNGDKVEVVSKTPSASFQDVPDYSNLNQLNKSVMKPAPPPRNYEDYTPKPNLPHPPKSQQVINKQKEYSKILNSKKVETVYANIGEVRSALTPNKPHRTASMREREAQQQKRANNNNNNNGYENVNVKNLNSNSNSNENYYDYVNNRSSSPECDSKTNGNRRELNGLSQKSESNIDISSENYYNNNKYQNCGIIPRSLSLTYCGSETESEIYSPYSFCGSESEIAEDENDHQWGTTNGKIHKLRSKKGRSIVHKNLEDNYGAVIVANHEALAQVLENIQQNAPIQPALRGLKSLPSLRWTDFTIKNSAQSVIIGPRAFHQAIWGSQHVTLVISTGTASTTTLSLGVYALMPVTEFSDLIPVQYLPEKPGDASIKQLQASVAILPWMQVHTIESYGDLLKSKSSQSIDDHGKDASFILLQLVNSLKVLQAQGIEELPSSLSTFVLSREVDKDTHYRIYVLQGLGEDAIRKNDDDTFITLCQCASNAMLKLQIPPKIASLIQNLLKNERAVSLTQTKSVLEFSLWGPSDVALSNSIKEREQALQRWLDLQRATVLHGLVCTKVQLNVYEECHLLFLVRSTARMMSDASLLLESSNKQNGGNLNGIKS
ncbi:putative uncharacterized protein DDB_G0277255 isoform X1 [Onthophagus taurus]|uniref:putative uncharacterized protein DDB_G0277255 isoform X1 n=2 Tax=Onthophagus taurus TaxID=166361 RepID=UPI0039BE4A0A